MSTLYDSDVTWAWEVINKLVISYKKTIKDIFLLSSSSSLTLWRVFLGKCAIIMLDMLFLWNITGCRTLVFCWLLTPCHDLVCPWSLFTGMSIELGGCLNPSLGLLLSRLFCVLGPHFFFHRQNEEVTCMSLKFLSVLKIHILSSWTELQQFISLQKLPTGRIWQVLPCMLSGASTHRYGLCTIVPKHDLWVVHNFLCQLKIDWLIITEFDSPTGSKPRKFAKGLALPLL